MGKAFSDALPATILLPILDGISWPVLVLDDAARLVFANEAFCTFVGHDRGGLVGRRLDDILAADAAAALASGNDLVLSGGEPLDYEAVWAVRDGEAELHRLSKQRLVLNINGEDARHVLLTMQDISGLKTGDGRLEGMLERDTLTGLASRSRFFADFPQALNEVPVIVALLIIDCDRLKAVNDTYGRSFGDRVLCKIAARLSALVGSNGQCARIGGDRFAALVNSTEGAEGLVSSIHRLHQKLIHPLFIDGQALCVGVSMGLSLFPDDARSAEDLFNRAEVALGIEKQVAGGGVRRLPAADAASLHAADWDIATSLHHGLAAGELSLAYQPIVGAQDGELTGFEALLRWSHPVLGNIAPDVAVAAAESSGQIYELGLFVLRTACLAARQWPQRLRISVNVSATQLTRANFAEMVEIILKECDLPAERLEIEITESVMFGKSDQVMDILKALHHLGVSIALDDFGTGWSSLETLAHFRFDRVKIDRSFINRLDQDPRSTAIVKAIQALCHTLCIPVTVEGIERQDQLDFVRELDCQEVQGFLIGRPAATVDGWIPRPEIDACEIDARETGLRENLPPVAKPKFRA